MLKGKSQIEIIILQIIQIIVLYKFSPNDYEKNDKIILKKFQ